MAESFNGDAVEIAGRKLPIGRLYKHDVIRVLNSTPLAIGKTRPGNTVKA